MYSVFNFCLANQLPFGKMFLQIFAAFLTTLQGYVLTPTINYDGPIWIDELKSLPKTPVVLMHGMGDAAANPGMQSIRRAISGKLNGAYVKNIAIGQSAAEDTKNGFFMNLDDQVEYFARVVRSDSALREGFNAMGFSQGNLIIRGYIERYNSPPVLNFVSVHGPMMGVGALPQCKPTAIMCKTINNVRLFVIFALDFPNHMS